MVLLLHGDCVEEMKSMEENSVDAIVCDPPYGLKFMGKKFDTFGDGAAQQEWHAVWLREAFRVLKSGGRIKAFGGTRTFHRLAAAMQECGFLDIHTESWNYTSGFPHYLDIEKQMEDPEHAAAWRGFATTLKPSWEPVCTGVKP